MRAGVNSSTPRASRKRNGHMEKQEMETEMEMKIEMEIQMETDMKTDMETETLACE